MNTSVYLDCASTTPVRKEVIEAMLPYFNQEFANPSGLYDIAVKNKVQIEKTRAIIAETLGCKKNEIYFTSGGTESDNWAIRIAVEHSQNSKPHIITSKIEHHAILRTCEFYEKCGVEVTYLDVDADGIVNLNQLENSIKSNTVLISIMTANNEIGVIQPLKIIGEIAERHNVPFHTDAVQAYGHMKISVTDNNISMLSASAHKFNGPKGVGFLYISDVVPKVSLLYGGSQEEGFRAGTENVPGIVGMGVAARLSYEDLDNVQISIASKRDYLIKRIKDEIDGAYLNGSINNRLSNNINFCFEEINGSMLLRLLNQKKIYVSSGSACNSKSILPSHVLIAIGVPDELALGALRITIDDSLTRYQMDELISDLKDAVETVRNFSS